MIEKTIKRTSEKKLLETVRLQKSILDNIPVLQYNISPDGIILDCNKLVLETLGYKNKNDLIGKPLVATVYAPSSLKKAKKLFLIWKKTGIIKNEELQIKAKNGRIIDALLNVNTLYDNNGKVQSSISTQIDISELKKAEKEIESLARFPSENPNPVLRINKIGKVLYANTGGIKQIKKLGSNVDQKAPNVFYDIVTKLFKKKQTIVGTLNIHLGDMDFEYIVTPVKNTDYANLYGRDVTKQKKAQEEILNLARFPSENPNPVFRVNNKFSVIYANGSAKKILQKTKDNKILKILSALISNTKKLKTAELEIGDLIYEFNIIPVKDTDYFNIYGKDITDMKKAEKLLLIREKEKISIDERDRLAQELHDTVTQTLFSANLIAEVIPKLWEKNPKVAIKRLEEVRQLNSTALEEMRILLFELKSLSFENENLGDLFKKLAKSLNARSGIPLKVQIDEKYKHSSKVELGFYRIAQEALNNIAKHSDATEASLLLKSSSKHLKLLICDNGNGFTPKKIRPENLGLTIMRERAKLMGASMDISTIPGKGTKISLTYTR